MEKKLIIMKLETLYKEYTSYKDYYENFMEDVDGKKTDIASKIGQENFEDELEDFVLEAFVLRHVYNSDLDILADKIITYLNAARLMGFEEEVSGEIHAVAKDKRDKEIKPNFIIEQGKPMEVREGFVEEQRKAIKEQGNISKLIQRISK